MPGSLRKILSVLLTTALLHSIAAAQSGPQAPREFDPAMPPVNVTQIEVVMRADLAHALESGLLAPGTGIGVAIGVITKDGRSVFTLGAARREHVFEIGSITKPFTGLLLAQAIEQGTVRLDTPLRELLPRGRVAKPDGAEITLRDLACHRSGLPRNPEQLRFTGMRLDYNVRRLERYIIQRGVARPDDPPYHYSNTGFALLGEALARKAGKSYAELLDAQVLRPLGMKDSAIRPPRRLRDRIIQGHRSDGTRLTGRWGASALVAAGGIRTTVDDMLLFLEALLSPAEIPVGEDAGRTLPAALRRSLEPLADAPPDAPPGQRVAYAWGHEPSTGLYGHNGSTGGYSSDVFFNPREGYAAVVLVNITSTSPVPFNAELGRHLLQRLTGKPAVSLARW